MPTQRLLADWTADQVASIERAIYVANHHLAQLDLFSDAGIVETLARHPDEDLGVNTMGADPTRRDEWREGSAGNCSAQVLIDAVKRGRLWLNLRRVMDHHAEYRELVNGLYEELEQLSPGLRTYNRSANLLISSPNAIVYYHLDCPVNMLWHIRGRKRVWAYPLDSGIVADETVEAVLCGDAAEELEFRPEYDELAQSFDVEPGQMITWPQHTPHRVVNTEGLNVSLSTEHMTRAAARRNNVYLANRHFRSLFGGGFQNSDTDGRAAAAKEFSLRLCRRVPMLAPKPPQGYEYPQTFVVDPEAFNCIRYTDGTPNEAQPVVVTLPAGEAGSTASPVI